MTAPLMISLVILLIIGVPIGLSIGSSALIALVFFSDFSPILIVQRHFNGVDSFPMMAIPFFLLGGLLMESGGVSRRLVDLISMILGKVPGGLAVVNAVGSAFFGAISGSSPATVAAIGGVCVPGMIKEGYDKGFATATAASTGFLGSIIPPSIIMVSYCVATGVSVGDLFLAGILPGIILCIGMSLFAVCVGYRNGYRSKKYQNVTWKDLSIAFFRALPAIIMPLIVLGGIYGGVFTPTEAGNIAVIYGFLVGFFVYKELDIKKIPGILKQTAINTAAILFIVGAANAFGNVMAREGLPAKMADFIIGVSGSKIVFLLLVNILFLFLGTFVESNSAAILFAPILLPVALHYGIDPVHFGIILVVNLAIGLITPPLGVNLYVAAGIINEKVNVVLNKYFVGYLLVSIALLFVFTYMPEFTMSLYRVLKGA